MSRAYYGSFHLALQFLEELGIAVPRDHGEVCRCLLQSGHADCHEAGRKLSDLQADRVRADYRLNDTAIERPLAARLGVERAHEFRSLLALCKQEPSRTQIQTGIDAYRQRIRGPAQG